ncbi:MAG: hypothetical protein F4207_07910 [Gemmatimonadetes bacterium]|nr:hypothetical protein [Gemmatimonadota bacterium]MYG16332.1 hypothetical protein [Gemmatimonadota bacterium]MYH17681.1 hypothetical protein [Gemmatimonadota bacterium]
MVEQVQVNGSVVQQIGFPELDKLPVRSQYGHRSPHGGTGEGVEHDIHALPIRLLHDFFGEIQRSGIHYMGNAHIL